MTLYFSGAKPSTSPLVFQIGRATSTNYGRSWTVDPQTPVVSEFECHFPHQPSVIHIQDTPTTSEYLMAHGKLCKGAGTAQWELSTIEFLYSTNGGITWYTRTGQGSVLPDACGGFADGSVNRPRLVKDPAYSESNPKIHLFYSAYEWGGSVVTRDCGRIGHAISMNNGLDWTKQNPALEPTRSNQFETYHWDKNQVLKPSLVIEPCTSGAILRLFYEGNDGENPAVVGIGIADAPWPFGSSPTGCSSGTLLALDEQPMLDGEEGLALLKSVPNPTRGTTTIEVDLSRAQVAGEAEITIIDVTGRLVRHLWTGSSLSAPSSIKWDGRESSGARVAPGRYLARMRIGDTTASTHWITITR